MSKAYETVRIFEQEIANWAGAKYGVAVESCCSAIFLSLLYINTPGEEVIIPKRTYPGVAMAIENADYYASFHDSQWEGAYGLIGTNIIDSALRFKKNMYVKDSFYCLSFHYKKILPIGRGGMILTDNEEAVTWLKKARFDGRTEGIPLDQYNAKFCGWNMYMTPEQATRGLMLFELIKDKENEDLKVSEQGYPDLSTWRAFKL